MQCGVGGCASGLGTLGGFSVVSSGPTYGVFNGNPTDRYGNYLGAVGPPSVLFNGGAARIVGGWQGIGPASGFQANNFGTVPGQVNMNDVGSVNVANGNGLVGGNFGTPVIKNPVDQLAAYSTPPLYSTSPQYSTPLQYSTPSLYSTPVNSIPVNSVKQVTTYSTPSNSTPQVKTYSVPANSNSVEQITTYSTPVTTYSTSAYVAPVSDYSVSPTYSQPYPVYAAAPAYSQSYPAFSNLSLDQNNLRSIEALNPSLAASYQNQGGLQNQNNNLFGTRNKIYNGSNRNYTYRR